MIYAFMYNERILLFEKKSVLFSRYSVFCTFEKLKNIRICDVIIDIAAHEKLQ